MTPIIYEGPDDRLGFPEPSSAFQVRGWKLFMEHGCILHKYPEAWEAEGEIFGASKSSQLIRAWESILKLKDLL